MTGVCCTSLHQVVVDAPSCVVCMGDDVIPAFTDGCSHRECCGACLHHNLAGNIGSRCPLCRVPYTRVL